MQRRHAISITIWLLVLTLLSALLTVESGTTGPLLALLVIGGGIIASGIAYWLWKRPVRGLYVLFSAACAIDVDYSDKTTNGYFIAHYLPFWQDFTAWTHVHIVTSVAELLMALLLVIWVLKGVAERSTRWRRGTLALPVVLYMLMVLVGELHGVGTGGSVTVSLWELRGQIYMVVVYVLACNLINSRRDINALMWILVLAVGFRAIEGTIRYFLYYRGHVQQVVDVFPHEQAFFFNAFITFAGVLFVYGGSRRLKRVVLLLLPFVGFIDLATDRRAAVAALGVGAILFLICTLVAYPPRRRLVGTILLVLGIGFPPYYLAFQHKSGTLATPARAVASMFHPDSRDAASNQYRISENYDIMSTMRSSTASAIIGYGFGKPMLTPQPLPDISMIYVWWNIMPHNSILWVWMRLGTIGFILLWFMLCTAIIQSMKLMRRLRDPQLQSLALFIGLMLVQEVIFGYLDLQWTNYRNLVSVGLLFALISRIAMIAAKENSLSPDAKSGSVRHARRLDTSQVGTLAVVNHRLVRKSA